MLSAFAAAGRGHPVQTDIDISHCNRFGPISAAEIRKRREHQRSYSLLRWHVDEVFVPINGVQHYLWRAVDHEGEVIKVFASKRKNRKAALKFLRCALKRYGSPKIIVTDRLASYGAALKVLRIKFRQRCGRWLNNRAKNSHQPFRRREGAMARFRGIKSQKKFASGHAVAHNHFNLERHLVSRDIYHQNQSTALAEWRYSPPELCINAEFQRPFIIGLTAPILE